MSKMNVNPQKVEELIKRLQKHTQDTMYQHKQLKSFLINLQQEWDDAHYHAFMQQYNEFEIAMQKALYLSENVLLPNLKNVKKFAEDYKNLGR